MTASQELNGHQRAADPRRNDRDVVPKDLRQPLRLRFVVANRVSSVATPSGRRLQERSSLPNPPVVDADELPVVHGTNQLHSNRWKPSTGRPSLRSNCLTFGYGVAAVVLFWLYAMPALRQESDVATPGMFESNDAGPTQPLSVQPLDGPLYGPELATTIPIQSDVILRERTASPIESTNASVAQESVIGCTAPNAMGRSASQRSPRVFAMAHNPMHVPGVGQPSQTVVKPTQDTGEVSSGTLATQLGSLNPELRSRAAQMLLERGWQEDHLELARRFLRAPLSMQKEMVDSLSQRSDINVIPWFLWMLEVAEPDLAGLLVAHLKASVSPRDASAIRTASMSENHRFRGELRELADQLDQRSY